MHPLEKIKFGVIPITVYRGRLVTKIIGGWEVFEKKALTIKDVDRIIDEAEKSLQKSLYVPKQ